MRQRLSALRSRFRTCVGPRGSRPLALLIIPGVLACSWALRAEQPQVTITVPGQRVSEGYFEYSATSWTLVGPRGFVRFGPQSPVVSPFAGFGDSGTGLGVHLSGHGFQAEFFGQWSQGFRRSMVTQSSEITFPNGSWGTVGDQAVTPFVVGFVPIVGGPPGDGLGVPFPPGLVLSPGRLAAFPGLEPTVIRPGGKLGIETGPEGRGIEAGRASEKRGEIPCEEPQPPRLSARQAEAPLVLGGSNGAASPSLPAGPSALREPSSTAEYVAMSVEEARRRYEAELAERNATAAEYLRRAEAALAAGKGEVAKIYLRLAAGRASGQLRETILQKLEKLEQAERERRVP